MKICFIDVTFTEKIGYADNHLKLVNLLTKL